MRQNIVLHCDLCIIGGGMSGIAAAVTASRLGLKVVLVQDRNVLGGNASSEIRMWIRGAGLHFPTYREGGIIEELALDNMHYNPNLNYSVWDGVLYNKVVSEKNIKLLLGTTCISAEYQDSRIVSISAWQLQSYNKYEIKAKYFADCSGDCILAEFIPANVMEGRESKNQFDEEPALETADSATMGNTCMLQLRRGKEKNSPSFPFEKDIGDLIDKRINVANKDWKQENFWWLEFGGDEDALRNAEKHNATAISAAFSTYRHIRKKVGDSFDWSLDWVGFLAGKRETRRYVGDYILTANDLLDSVEFDDEIAYGGWSLDVHYPKGLYAKRPNVHYHLKKPYSIPYRCIYSQNIDNLFFAGRNISVTHLALSSTRVMATCAMIGQAVGVACFVANRYKETPRGALKYIAEIQQTLLAHDCLLLNTKRQGVLCQNEERTFSKDNRIKLKKGESWKREFSPCFVNKIRLVFDSDFARKYIKDSTLKYFPTLCYNGSRQKVKEPPTLVKDFTIRYRINGKWQEKNVVGNFQRLVFIDIFETIDAIEFVGNATYGNEKILLYSLDII